MEEDKESKEKLPISLYFKVGFRSLKEYWKLDKLNLICQIILNTISVVGTMVSVYIASRVLGEVILSAQNGSHTEKLFPLLVLQLLAYLVTTASGSLKSLFVDLLYIRNEEYYTIKLNSARADLDTEYYEDRSNQKLLNKVAEKGAWAMFEFNMQIIYLYA